jgi:hypothetical protein
MAAQGQLITGDRRDRILALIRDNPDASNREIARQADVDHKTVASIRGGGAAKTAAPAWSRDIAIAGFGRLLDLAMPETLDDLARLLGDRALRMTELRLDKRRAWVIAYGKALLGVDLTEAFENARTAEAPRDTRLERSPPAAPASTGDPSPLSPAPVVALDHGALL